jgi:hypothetical protein
MPQKASLMELELSEFPNGRIASFTIGGFGRET